MRDGERLIAERILAADIERSSARLAADTIAAGEISAAAVAEIESGLARASVPVRPFLRFSLASAERGVRMLHEISARKVRCVETAERDWSTADLWKCAACGFGITLPELVAAARAWSQGGRTLREVVTVHLVDDFAVLELGAAMSTVLTRDAGKVSVAIEMGAVAPPPTPAEGMAIARIARAPRCRRLLAGVRVLGYRARAAMLRLGIAWAESFNRLLEGEDMRKARHEAAKADRELAEYTQSVRRELLEERRRLPPPTSLPGPGTPTKH